MVNRSLAAEREDTNGRITISFRFGNNLKQSALPSSRRWLLAHL